MQSQNQNINYEYNIIITILCFHKRIMEHVIEYVNERMPFFKSTNRERETDYVFYVFYLKQRIF